MKCPTCGQEYEQKFGIGDEILLTDGLVGYILEVQEEYVRAVFPFPNYTSFKIVDKKKIKHVIKARLEE